MKNSRRFSYLRPNPIEEVEGCLMNIRSLAADSKAYFKNMQSFRDILEFQRILRYLAQLAKLMRKYKKELSYAMDKRRFNSKPAV